MGGTARCGPVRKRLVYADGFLRSFVKTHKNSDGGVRPAFSLMLVRQFNIFTFLYAGDFLLCQRCRRLTCSNVSISDSIRQRKGSLYRKKACFIAGRTKKYRGTHVLRRLQYWYVFDVRI